jgi:hypothetical protein
MEQSILKSTKKVLNVGADDTAFDLDIITHINSAFSILNQLGIGPIGGFVVDDDTSEWEDFIPLTSPYLGLIKTCIYLRVRLLFDPPQTSFLLTAAENTLREQEYRLSSAREATDWVDPDPPDAEEDEDEELVVDGGGA